MDNVDLINLISVSYPEILMLIITAIAIVGCHNYLILKNKKQVIRLLISVAIMALLNVLVRKISGNVIEVLFISTTMYFFVTWLIMKIPWYKLAVGIIVSYLFLVALELLYVPFALWLTKITMQDIILSDLYRFNFSAPERIVQLIIVIICVKKRLTIINLSRVDNMSNVNKLKLALITGLMFFTMLLISIYAKVFLFNKEFRYDFKLILFATFRIWNNFFSCYWIDNRII